MEVAHVIKPVIHLNGTGRDALVEQYADTVTVLRGAVKALENASPNGRDYYPLGADAHTQAVFEHSDRMQRLLGILSEIEALRDHCADA